MNPKEGLSPAGKERLGRTHLENFLYDTVAPFRIIRDAWRENRQQFGQETLRALDLALNPFPKDEMGKRYFNSRAIIYWTGLATVISGCSWAIHQIHNPGPDTGGGGATPHPDQTPTPGSLCSTVLSIAAASPQLPDAVIVAADKTSAQVQKQLSCFVPNYPVVGEVLNSDTFQLAWTSPGEIQVQAFLAIAGLEVDGFQPVNFFSPYTDKWETVTPNQVKTELTAVYFDSASQTFIAEASNGAVVTASRDFNNNLSFTITTADNIQQTLTLEQVTKNLAFSLWFDQVNALFAGMDMTHPEFTSVPGVDHGLAGEPYLLPQDVFSALRQRKAAPIELNNGVVGGAGNGSCSVAIPDLLVSGSRLQADGGAVAVYAFDGQPDQLAFWNNLPVLEGVRCVAFVAQEGNQWNLAPGTVAVWFFSGGGKGPAQIINADNPVRIMTDAANSARFSFSNNELTMTTLDSSGALIETQSVAFLPPLPEQFLSQVPQDSYSYDADGLHLALASGQTLDIAADKIADSLKNGAAGTYLALGEAIVNPTEKDSRSVAAYYDGSQWVIPDASKNMRYTPEIMQIKGVSVPAVIEMIDEQSMPAAQAAASLSSEIEIAGEDNISHFASGDYQRLTLYRLALCQKTLEQITVFPGAGAKEETIYQVRLTLAYLSGGRVRQVQFLIKGEMGGINANQKMTPEFVDSYYKIGSRYVASFRFPLDTPSFNRSKALANIAKCTDYGTTSCYSNWETVDKFYSFTEIENLLKNSDTVIFGKGVGIASISKDR